MALSDQTKKISGIVSLAGDNSNYLSLEEIINSMDDYFLSFSSRYAFRVHDMDFDAVGNPKTLHIHFVADMKKRQRLSTLLNALSLALDVDPLAVSIQKYTSFEGCFQYLCHRNNPDKVQYCLYLVHSNLPYDEMKLLMKEDVTALDMEGLFSIVANASSKTEILSKIGLYYYRLYRGVIFDLWSDLHPYNYVNSNFKKGINKNA